MNLEELTIKNQDYRRVIYTGKMQLVVMSLIPGEDIPWEVHEGDQFIRVEKGIAKIIINKRVHIVNPNEFVVIPAGVKHYVVNILQQPLKLYAVYTPPEHQEGHIDHRQP